MDKGSRKEKTGSAGNNPEEWRTSFFVNGDNQLYIPGLYLFSTFKAGGKYVKEGKGGLGNKVAATLQIEDDIILLNRHMPEGWETIPTDEMPQNPTDDVFLHICGVVNPSTKGRNVRYRIACASGWECSFVMIWDSSIVAVDKMRQVVEDSGVLVGLADGRSIGNGRFEVTEFKLDK
jgi:hypothetical protein